jgi:uncharacterized protein YrzB (UPF0473 family)
MDEKPQLLYIGDDGTEKTMTILLTFQNEKNNKQFVLFYDEQDDSDEVHAMEYDDAGNLMAITDDSDWQMVEETFNAFMEAQNDNEDDEN